MRDPLRNVPVRFKLALTFAGVCAIAFGLGGYLVSGSTLNALEKEVLARLELQSRSHAAALEGSLSALQERARDFASDGFIRAQFENWQRNPQESESSALRAHLLENKLPIAPAFQDLALVALDGDVFHAHADRSGWVKEALEDLPADRDGFSCWLTSSTEHPTLAVSTPLTSLDGTRTIGRLLAQIHPGVWIVSSLARIAGPLEAQVPELALIDREGTAMQLPQHLLQTPAISLDSDIVQSGFGLSLSDTPHGLQGRGLFERVSPVASSGWIVRTTLDSREALRAVSGLQARFVAFWLALTFVAAAFLIFPMRFLARPLLALRDAARRVQGGDFSWRVPVESTDEIGELSEAFNMMTEAVEERTSRLESAAEDLARRKNELRDERDRLNAVIGSMRDGLVVLDSDGEPEVWNAAASPLLGLIEDHEIGLSSHHACHDRDGLPPERARSACAKCLFSPAAPPRSCLIDIGSQVFEIHSTRLAPNADGRSGRVLVSRDVTDRIGGDEREIHQERLAVLGEVAAVVAHELNNPLAAIVMFNQMMGSELPADSPLQENVSVVARNADTCKHAIRELLDYSTGASPEIATVDVHATLQDVARFLRTLAKRRDVDLSLELEAPVALVKCDEVQLRQVFVNLIMNAVQAASDEGGKVIVRTKFEDDHVVVLVSDDGPGIPEARADDIFRPFFTTKPRGSGTGLGLPTARRITEIQGGGLELLSSAPGHTTFQVRLLSRVS